VKFTWKLEAKVITSNVIKIMKLKARRKLKIMLKNPNNSKKMKKEVEERK